MLECFQCSRFVDCRWHDGAKGLTVRCRWYGAEPVREVMRLARAFVGVEPETRLEAARSIATLGDVEYLLVVSGSVLVGVLSCSDLDPQRGSNAGECMSSPVVVVAPDTSMEVAMSQMQRFSIGCLPVVEKGVLQGVITRDELWLD